MKLNIPVIVNMHQSVRHLVNVSKVDVPANSTTIKITLAVGSKSLKFNITLPNDAKGMLL